MGDVESGWVSLLAEAETTRRHRPKHRRPNASSGSNEYDSGRSQSRSGTLLNEAETTRRHRPYHRRPNTSSGSNGRDAIWPTYFCFVEMELLVWAYQGNAQNPYPNVKKSPTKILKQLESNKIRSYV